MFLYGEASQLCNKTNAIMGNTWVEIGLEKESLVKGLH